MSWSPADPPPPDPAAAPAAPPAADDQKPPPFLGVCLGVGGAFLGFGVLPFVGEIAFLPNSIPLDNALLPELKAALPAPFSPALIAVVPAYPAPPVANPAANPTVSSAAPAAACP